MKELSSLEEKMEYQLEERTRDMQDMLESCQTKVGLMVTYYINICQRKAERPLENF